MERPVPLFGILRPGGGGAGGGAGGNLRYSTLLEFSVLFTLGQVWQTWLFRWLKKKQNPKKNEPNDGYRTGASIAAGRRSGRYLASIHSP